MTPASELRENVETWLEEMGLVYEPMEEPGERFSWGVSVTGQAFRALVAEHRSGEHLWMQVSVRVAESHQEVLERLDRVQRELFLIDLRLALHAMPVGHWLDMPEEAKDDLIPTAIVVGINILEEPIKKAGFMRRNFQIQSAAGTISLYFQRLALKGEWS